MVNKDQLIKTINEVKINTNYSITLSELKAFRGMMDENLFEGVYNLFKYGYLKGQKALKTEMKRKETVV